MAAAKKTENLIFKNMSAQQFRDYCDFFDKNDISELFIEEDGVKLHLKSGGATMTDASRLPSIALPPEYYTQSQGMTHSSADVSVSEAPSGASTPSTTPEEAAAKAAAADPGKVIEAPMIGTFYASPTPDAAAYVKVGDRVAKGEKVCIVEAMKIMNEIESPYTGIVDEILIENGQSVAKGVPLIRLR